MLAVDHEERRRMIADVTFDVIATEGLEAATIRRIAGEIGCSTAVVTHYFSDKQQILMWAYKALASQAHDRIDKVLARDPADLVGALLAMIAIDETNMRRWRAYVAFWDRAARDPFFANEQRYHMNLTIRRIAEIIRARNGDRPDIEKVSRLLNALVQGLSVQALIDQQHCSEDRIRQILSEQVEMLLGKPAEKTP